VSGPLDGRFVVIGGGVAGLVAARALAKAGRDVTLFEARDRLGGTVTHHTVGGLVLDAGAESFATRRGTVEALATQLGLGLEVVQPAPAGAWLQRGDAAFPLPATSLLGIPGVPLAEDVVRVVGRRTAARAYLDALIPGTVGARSTTLGELVRARMGSGMLEKLVAPVTHGVHSMHPDDLDLDRVAPGLRHHLLRENSLARAVQAIRELAPAGAAASGIRGGVHRIVDELAADLDTYGVDVRLGERVERGDPRCAGASVVMAAPTTPVATRVALATLVLDAPHLDDAPRGSGVLVAAGTPGVTAKALTHATAKWPWLAERAGGKHVVRLSYGSDSATSDSAPSAELALADAAVLLGVELPAASVLDFDLVEWSRPAPFTDVPDDDVTYLGESVSGTGLANVIAHAEAATAGLLARDEQGEALG
jgi:oxygen-dependent protoporphyrinogen oxidase